MIKRDLAGMFFTARKVNADRKICYSMAQFIDQTPSQVQDMNTSVTLLLICRSLANVNGKPNDQADRVTKIRY